MLLVGLPVHEFSHALAAFRLGDGTAKLFGRLTLNPIAHFDPVGGTLLALTFIGSAAAGSAFGFGWAKPTPVNPLNLEGGRRGEAHRGGRRSALEPRPRRRRRDPAAVPAGQPDAASIRSRSWPTSSYYFVQINLLLMIFNFIPIPPLDGSKVMFAFMDRRTEYQVRPFLEQYGFLILIVAPVPAARELDRRADHQPDPRCALQPPGGRLGPASSGRTCGRRVAPEERAALVTWTTPAQLALFDSMHVADRRHGLDVVASLRADGVRDDDVLLAGLLHDAGKGDTGRLATGRVHARCQRTGPGSGVRPPSCPGFGPALERLADARRDLGRAGRRRRAARLGRSS